MKEERILKKWEQLINYTKDLDYTMIWFIQKDLTQETTNWSIKSNMKKSDWEKLSKSSSQKVLSIQIKELKLIIIVFQDNKPYNLLKENE